MQAKRMIQFNQLAKAGYNRVIRRTWVNKIKREFNESLVRPVIVSFRDGKYWVIDGQHTSQALYELNGYDPNTLIECDVRTGLTYEDEARLFVKYNNSSHSIGKVDEVKGLIESQDPDAVAFLNIVTKHGYNLGDDNSSLAAISNAWSIFNNSDGMTTLDSILKITRACWPDDTKATQAKIIEGLEEFLRRHGDEYSFDHFVKMLRKSKTQEIIDSAKPYYDRTPKRYKWPYCVYTEIVTRYNYGLSKKQQLPIMPLDS